MNQEYAAIARIASSTLYSEASDGFIQTLIENEIATSWPKLTQSPKRQQGLDLLASYLKEYTTESNLPLTVEFNRLFIGPETMPAAPWGSVYLFKDQLLNGDSTVALKAFFKRNNIDFKLNENQPVDHLGLIFAAMELLLNTPDNKDSENQLRILIGEHMCPWVYRVLELIFEHANSDYYRGFSLLIEDFVDTLINELNIIPSQRPIYR